MRGRARSLISSSRWQCVIPFGRWRYLALRLVSMKSCTHFFNFWPFCIIRGWRLTLTVRLTAHVEYAVHRQTPVRQTFARLTTAPLSHDASPTQSAIPLPLPPPTNQRPASSVTWRTKPSRHAHDKMSPISAAGSPTRRCYCYSCYYTNYNFFYSKCFYSVKKVFCYLILTFISIKYYG